MTETGLTIAAALLALSFGASKFIVAKYRKLKIRNKTLLARGVSYQITETDMLWLARLLVGESGTQMKGGAAVAYAIANNFMLVESREGRRPRFDTFHACIRAYSSVLSPRWASPDSPGCIEHPNNCLPGQLRRRAEITCMPWNRIPAKVRALVLLFSTGKLKNPIGNSVDWASHSFVGVRREIGGNYFGTLTHRRVVS